jgi:hypothetical protein
MAGVQFAIQRSQHNQLASLWKKEKTMNPEICKTDARIFLTRPASRLQNGCMVRAEDVASALRQQGNDDMKRLKQIRSEQAKIRPQYNRFRDLDSEAKDKEARLRRTMSLLNNVYELSGEKTDEFKDYMASINDLTLWEAMTAVLEQESRMQIYELQHVLEQLGKKVSRQAIESAIVTHKEKFATRTQGRDKFVSLKR